MLVLACFLFVALFFYADRRLGLVSDTSLDDSIKNVILAQYLNSAYV